MELPYRAGLPLPESTWRNVRFRTVFEHCKWDVQSEDHCVLAHFPLLITQQTWSELSAIATKLSAELAAAERELLGRQDLHHDLGLPKALRREFARFAEPPNALARVMRFDFHFTSDGWRISEVNADVPGGFIEASGFTQLMASHYPGTFAPPDPAEAYARAVAARLTTNATVAMVHATAYSDDRQVMQFLAKYMAKCGLRIIPASPEHILWKDGRARISSCFANSPLDALVRFFPAEWLPRLRQKSRWTSFFAGNRTPTSNPTTAMLVQTKRFPLVWNHLSTDLPTWRSTLPETVCPSTVSSDLGDWVVKPALGRVGENIAISGVIPHQKLKLIHKAAKRHPSEWIAQRRFTVIPISDGIRSYYPSIGVFTVDGAVAGAYARIGPKPLIDDEAQDVAVLITTKGGGA